MMILRVVVLLTLAFGLFGCAHKYVPSEYIIAEGRIAPFVLAGTVMAAPAPDPIRNIRVDVGFHHWDFTNQVVAQAIAEQLMTEVHKNGSPTSSTEEKTITILVRSFSVAQGAWTFNGLLGSSVTLGDGTVIEFSVPNNSPGNIWRTLNGTIARTVMEILGNVQVLEYLAREPA